MTFPEGKVYEQHRYECCAERRLSTIVQTCGSLTHSGLGAPRGQPKVQDLAHTSHLVALSSFSRYLQVEMFQFSLAGLRFWKFNLNLEHGPYFSY